jgi:hypothetical protein
MTSSRLRKFLLERLILQRIQPLIEDITPINQAGFCQHRNSTEHDAYRTWFSTPILDWSSAR